MYGFKWMCVALVLALGLLSSNVLLHAQSTLGSINGVVTDPSGAVLPGAQVTLTNTETGYTQQAVTGSNGIYNFRDLPVGTYSVFVKSTGFESQQKTGLVLYANQAVTADVQMLVSGVKNSVEVSAAQTLIDTQNTDLTDVITGSSLLKMSLLSRQGGATGLYSNYYYAPGAQDPESHSVNNGEGNSAGTPTVDGSRQLDTMITMDGMTVMQNVDNLGGGPVQPSYESVQEIHTVMSDAPAEFWRPSAITVVTKTGTNEFHGGLFYDYNGNALNARSYFATSVPFRVENNYAASIGGPVIKNKLFFFTAYEGARNAQDDVVVGNVPLPAWRTGNFSSLSQPLINPYTGTAFPGNQIPTSLISPVSQYIQGVLYPQPNFGPPGLLAGNFHDLFPTRGGGFSDFDHGDASLEYILSQKDTFFLHNSYRHLPVQEIIGSLPSVGNFVESRTGADGVISENHIFTPNLINEFRLGYTYMKLAYHQTYDGYGLLVAAGMMGPFTTFEPKPTNVPQFSINSVSGTSGLLPYDSNIGYDYEYTDNLSWTRGKHLLKFGIDQILDHIDLTGISGEIYGSYTFNGLFSTNAYADFLLGLPQETAITSPPPTALLRGTMIGIYAQDQFQLNKRLTLNYGLRWEYQGPYSGAPYEMYSFDPKNGYEVIQTAAGFSHINPYFPSNIIPVETAAQAGYPSSTLLHGHFLDFYPRAGFAYQLFPRTVVQGAYGLYGNNIYGDQAAGIGNGGPFIGSSTFINKLTAGTPLFSFPEPFLSSGTTATQTAQATDPNVTVPYTQQWNLTIKQQLGGHGVVTVAYVGAATRNILLALNLDQPPPSTTPFSTAELTYPKYNAVDWSVNAGVDNYNSFQVSMRETRGRNLTVDTGLTVAKDLTDAADTGTYDGYPPENRFCLGCEYGHNGLTRRLTYYLNANYQFPFGKGQRFLATANQWQDEIIGGWAIAADSIAMSGPFFTPYVNSGFDTANTNTSFDQRPDQIGNPHVSSRSIYNWFNINAYSIPGCPTTDPLCTHSTPVDVGRFGDVKPGGLVGPDYLNVNLSLFKDFRVTGGSTFQLRLTVQNAFNHPNFDIPDWKVTDGPGVSGVITGLAGADLGAREVDIMGRFSF